MDFETGVAIKNTPTAAWAGYTAECSRLDLLGTTLKATGSIGQNGLCYLVSTNI